MSCNFFNCSDVRTGLRQCITLSILATRANLPSALEHQAELRATGANGEEWIFEVCNRVATNRFIAIYTSDYVKEQGLKLGDTLAFFRAPVRQHQDEVTSCNCPSHVFEASLYVSYEACAWMQDGGLLVQHNKAATQAAWEAQQLQFPNYAHPKPRPRSAAAGPAEVCGHHHGQRGR